MFEKLSLALLVFRNLAHYKNAAPSPDRLAAAADFFD